MSKIEECEKKIISYGLTDDIFYDFQILIRKVPKSQRLQHCYTTAIQISSDRYKEAIKLIEFGLDNYDTDWFSSYTSHLYIGKIFEKAYKYQEAYNSYKLAMMDIEKNHASYIPELSLDILWMKLHIDSFKCSDEIEQLYDSYSQSGEFSKGFINNEFRAAVAETVILLSHGKMKSALKSYERALEIVKGRKSKILGVLTSHKCCDKFISTPESIQYLTNLEMFNYDLCE